MSLEILKIKAELKELVDTFANLADEKKIPEQMFLFTPDTVVKVYIGGNLVFDIAGIKQLEETFLGFTANVKRSYHLNGQHVVTVDRNTAKAVLYGMAKLVTEEEGKEILTEHHIIYNDTYVLENKKWLIKERISNFSISKISTL